MNKEDFFISIFSNNQKSKKFIGDDGAVVDNFVYSQDAFFENIHFKREWMSLKEVAKKAMLINISDAIVMNAVPKYALLTVAIPKFLKRSELEELASGFLEVAKEYGIEIIGGDTISNIKLDISITIISEVKEPIFRKGLRNNHLLAFSGTLGDSKKDLTKLLRGDKVAKKSKFLMPKLNQKFFYEVAPYISVALDISDGLFFELERVAKANKLSFKFFREFSKTIGCSGEEYEILFGFDKRHKAKIESIAKKYRVKLNIFAKAKRGKYKCKCKAHHF